MPIVNEKNRGYYKIKGAVSTFNFSFKEKVVLDIGSSTGGFTELALEYGAKKVIAVEKGTNQMKVPLRFDSRVELHEKTDIFDFKLSFEDKIDVIVADISFLSLREILKYAKKYLANEKTKFLVMLKPQFEARSDQLNKGIVKNEKIRREILTNFEKWLKEEHFLIIKKHDNELRGRNGNLERFYWLEIEKSS